MRKSLMALGALVLSMVAVNGAQAAQSCNRSCLTGVLDSYLLGVIRHDPKAAPLAAGYRGTENAVEVKAGEGTWKSLKMLGSVQRRYIDPVSGQAAYFGTVEEADGTSVASLRIKVVDRKVVEAEWILGRKGAALYNPLGLANEPPSDKAIPAADRGTRAQLIAAATSYFDGLQTKNGAIVIKQNGCVRLENGTKVTQRNRPAPVAAPSAPGQPDAAHIANEFGGGDCASGFDRFQIRQVTHRSFPLVDEEMGVVLGQGMFLRPAGSTTPRLLLAEYFTTRGGKIIGIYASMTYLPATAPETTGWAGR